MDDDKAGHAEVVVEKTDGEYVLFRVYEHREKVKEAGGRWDATRRGWVIPKEGFDELRRYFKEVGVKVISRAEHERKREEARIVQVSERGGRLFLPIPTKFQKVLGIKRGDIFKVEIEGHIIKFVKGKIEFIPD